MGSFQFRFLYLYEKRKRKRLLGAAGESAAAKFRSASGNPAVLVPAFQPVPPASAP